MSWLASQTIRTWKLEQNTSVLFSKSLLNSLFSSRGWASAFFLFYLYPFAQPISPSQTFSIPLFYSSLSLRCLKISKFIHRLCGFKKSCSRPSGFKGSDFHGIKPLSECSKWRAPSKDVQNDLSEFRSIILPILFVFNFYNFLWHISL